MAGEAAGAGDGGGDGGVRLAPRAQLQHVAEAPGVQPPPTVRRPRHVRPCASRPRAAWCGRSVGCTSVK